ncbi:protein-tyrosine phosphatase-like protein [Aspergillus pseudoustus]|uniref:protein-tyrosine-phosphatase n=1 Tax=Aspergillus pseudoustus TaxID=1810923 RepID=A0ABR4JB06_9EURO
MGKTKRPSTGAVLPDFLYLGPVSAASDLKFLCAQGITVVISIGKSPARKHENISTEGGSRQEVITYHRLTLEDKEDADLSKCVQTACAILDEASTAKQRVLVHCSAAISRSPAVVAGYLILRRGYSLGESLDVLKQARPAVSPNRGFLEQLRKMEGEVGGARKGVGDGEGEGEVQDALAKEQ